MAFFLSLLLALYSAAPGFGPSPALHVPAGVHSVHHGVHAMDGSAGGPS
jgi:hypothetical protein